MEYLTKRNLQKVATVAAVAFAALKIQPLTQSTHSTKIISLSPKSVFPQYFANKQGLWIHTRAWLVHKPVGIIFLCHGYGEHIGRYEHVARYFNSQGFNVYGMDHQGHGQSDGDRAYVESFQDFVDDYLLFVSTVETEGLPRFLVGHSMGGLMSSLIVCQKPELWTGFVVSGPLIDLDPKAATPFIKKFARAMSNVLPKLPVEKLDASGLSGIQTVKDRYSADILNYTGGTRIRTFVCMLDGVDQLKAHMHQIKVPFLAIHGEDDPICLASGSKLLHATASSGDKSIKIYPGLLHEVYNEASGAKVLQDVHEWISKRN